MPNANFQLRRAGGCRTQLAIGIWQLAVWVAFVCYGSDAGNSSLSESKIDNAEKSVTITALLAQKEELRRQLSIQQETLKKLTARLADSNAEAELFRRKYSDLELRMEALGLESADKYRAKLDMRLLAAVSDLQLGQKKRDEFRHQMLRKNKAALRYLKTSQGDGAQASKDIEPQFR